MPWDPLDALDVPTRRLIWAALACSIALNQGGAFIANFWVPPRVAPEDPALFQFVPDFFQDYASARNHLAGLPIYTEHRHVIDAYLGTQEGDDADLMIEVNAHPPASVLLALPLARLSFYQAYLAWNLMSFAALLAGLWLIWRGLAVPLTPWAALPAVALLLICNPLWQHVRQGQLNALLLLLLTGTWSAERSGRPALAGILLGAATAIKLFPGFLILYFARRRRWAAVAAATAATAMLNGLAAATLGIGAYWSYLGEVLPRVRWFRACWNNASLLGFWSKLFDPAPAKERWFSLTEPLWHSPELARAGTLISSGAACVALAWVARPGTSRSRSDLSFGLAITAMLLVAPVTWEHYFLLLAIPLATTWLALPPTGPARAWFASILVALWLDPTLLWQLCIPGGPVGVARPAHVLGILSLQFYALLALFALGLRLLGAAPDREASAVPA